MENRENQSCMSLVQQTNHGVWKQVFLGGFKKGFMSHFQTGLPEPTYLVSTQKDYKWSLH